MKIINLVVFTIDEFPKDVQKKIIDNYRDINVEDNLWYQDIIEGEKEELIESGFENPEIFFSLDGGQGDGACFLADVNLEKFIDAHYEDEETKNMFRYLLDNEICCIDTCELKKHNPHYNHEYAVSVEYTTRNTDIDSDLYSEYKKHEAEIALFMDIVGSKRYDLSKQIHASLEDTLDILKTDEAVKETLLNNNYYFTESGKFFDIINN